MKYLILLFLFATSAGNAQENELLDDTQPPYLKDSRIEVGLKTGENYQFDGNEWKVVSRDSSRKVQALINKLRADLAKCLDELGTCKKRMDEMQNEINLLRESLADAESREKNRLVAYVGFGNDGLKVKKKSDDTKEVSSDVEPIIGVGYSRLLFDEWSVNGVVTRGVYGNSNNYSGLLGLGYDF